MANFKRTIVAAKAKVADAKFKAFMARLRAIDAILEDADPHDVLTPCAHALAAVAPECCEEHLDEFKAEFLQALCECIAMQQDADEPDDDSDTHKSVH
jgi:hypothetical protein